MRPPARLLRLAYQCAEDLSTRRRGATPPDIAAPPAVPLEESLRLAMEWLRVSHRGTGHRGCSKGFSYLTGWRDAYPETTAYIARTFIDYSEFSGEQIYLEEAMRMLDFLCDVQQEDGGILGGTVVRTRSRVSIVFNTGMALGGWLRGHEAVGDGRYIEAAARAADFLVRVRSDPALWLAHCYNRIPHVYHARVAWFLLAASIATGVARHRETALEIYEWVLGQQRENGTFRSLAFTPKRPHGNTHGLAYTLRGLLEGYRIENDRRYLAAVLRTSEVLVRFFEAHGRLPAVFDESWRPRSRSECLTGIAQLAIVWLGLHGIVGDRRYADAGLRAIERLRRFQSTGSRYEAIRGAIPGSYPIWGCYAPFQYPNWATKFFADALLLRLRLGLDASAAARVPPVASSRGA